MDEISRKDKILHDIRNALTVINASAGELEHVCQKPFRIKEVLTHLERQTKSVQQIVNLLAELDREFANGVPVSPEEAEKKSA
jgi:hypothetical protein